MELVPVLIRRCWTWLLLICFWSHCEPGVLFPPCLKVIRLEGNYFFLFQDSLLFSLNAHNSFLITQCSAINLNLTLCMSKVCVSVILAVRVFVLGDVLRSSDAFSRSGLRYALCLDGNEGARCGVQVVWAWASEILASCFCIFSFLPQLSSFSLIPSSLYSVFHASCSLISKFRLFFIAFLFPPLSPPPFLYRVKGVRSLSRCGTISSQLCAVTCGSLFPRCWPSRPWRRCWHRL